ncbi:MAG: hypothetical protein L6Q71_01700 [Planctomycetes bacterium]|nr:hypothetical protein [Planctomycetota bacterium]NUQ34513.1 hypothetical protein [Planctomycetaceae bacterium]
MKPAIRFVVCMALSMSAPLGACCMVPTSYPGDVDQNRQDVVILHHDGHQELVIRVAPFFKGSDVLPEYCAWVLTVPSKPTGYGEISDAVFGEAQRLYQRLEAERERAERMKSATNSNDAASAAGGGYRGLNIADPISVGPFTITEVTTEGEEAVGELNRYLGDNGFPKEDLGHMSYFARNNFTFLCIKILPKQGMKTLGKHLDLPALRVGFETKSPYYPGKFSSQQGNFALGLTLLTSDPVDESEIRAIRERLNATRPRYDNLWTEGKLGGELEKLTLLDSFSDVDRWYVNAFPSLGFNEKDGQSKPAIAGWTTDVFFPLTVDAGAFLRSPWLYGVLALGCIAAAIWIVKRPKAQLGEQG